MKKFFVPVLALLFILSFLLAQRNNSALFPDTQRLRLEVIPGDQFGGYLQTDSSTASNLHISAVSEIHIFVNNQKLPLSKAIADNLITVDELDAYARIDAKLGHCQMEWAEKNGFSMYVYHYPDFDFVSYYDVYVKPDRAKGHYQKIVIATGNTYKHVNESRIQFPYPATEDWGLAFSVTESTSDHLTLSIVQSGGQHFGTLSIEPGFTLIENNTLDTHTEYYNTSGLYLIENSISNNRTTEIVINWPQACGELPEGNYTLQIQIKDNFNSDELHPFMNDYTNQQFYTIDFTVTEP